MTPVTAAATLAQQFHEQQVTWIHRWNPGLMSLRISRPDTYRFLPGQFARIGIRTEDGQLLWRAYSIVSAPGEDFLEFFLVILPNGEFSGRVGRFNLGSVVLLDPAAQGFLTLERFKRLNPVEDLWMFATGTGLAPYLSMLRDAAVWTRFRHIVL
ncbi:MAG TPA: ferredoxin--NADP reductase, partial [Usitatibacteraceae bacterium]|nr:ferredoxin--NADP reductase [Usitatibacteraceae bacterium]